MKQRNLYLTMAVGGTIGVAAAFFQTIEKITLLKNKDALLTCDLNSVFNCSTVLNAWQSSVFGFPNSLMCLVLFVIFATSGYMGLSGGTLKRGYRLTIQALSLFTLGFALWFLWQSIYIIASLCILCIFCFSGLLLVNWAWLRINVHDLPVSERVRKILERSVERGTDTFIWILVGLAVALAMALRFA